LRQPAETAFGSVPGSIFTPEPTFVPERIDDIEEVWKVDLAEVRFAAIRFAMC